MISLHYCPVKGCCITSKCAPVVILSVSEESHDFKGTLRFAQSDTPVRPRFIKDYRMFRTVMISLLDMREFMDNDIINYMTMWLEQNISYDELSMGPISAALP